MTLSILLDPLRLAPDPSAADRHPPVAGESPSTWAPAPNDGFTVDWQLPATSQA